MSVAITWTAKDLEELERAIAKGVLRVKYTDKEIVYRSLDDMFALRDKMRKSLGCKPRITNCKVVSSKGLC